MNTAGLRKLALEAESKLRWGTAADYWQQAIDNYPARASLGARDIANMETRRQECLRAYFTA